MLCIGLSGRIASGKSSIANHFKSLGVPVISADQINAELLKQGTPAYTAILQYFGNAVLHQNKDINKSFLKEMIVHHPSQRQWLESLLHPMIRAVIQEQIQVLHAPYCIIEIPLKIEKSAYPYIDRILLVDCDEASQQQRLMSRDHLSAEEARALIKVQASREDYLQTADDMIDNSSQYAATQCKILEKIKKLHSQYLQF